MISVQSAAGFRLGVDYELMIKFNPDAFSSEKMLIQTVKEKSTMTMAEYVDLVKVPSWEQNLVGVG